MKTLLLCTVVLDCKNAKLFWTSDTLLYIPQHSWERYGAQPANWCWERCLWNHHQSNYLVYLWNSWIKCQPRFCWLFCCWTCPKWHYAEDWQHSYSEIWEKCPASSVGGGWCQSQSTCFRQSLHPFLGTRLCDEHISGLLNSQIKIFPYLDGPDSHHMDGFVFLRVLSRRHGDMWGWM